MTYDLTLILRDERGVTKVKLSSVPDNTFRENPALCALMDMHEHFMPQDKKPKETGA